MGYTLLDANEKFNPIKTFAGTINGNGATIKNVNIDIVYYIGEDGKAATGASAYLGWNSAGDFYGDKTGFGFVDVLDGGTIENVTVNYNMTDFGDDPGCKYTYFGGIAGVAKNGATISNCTVTGTIKAWNRVGGVVGYVMHRDPDNVQKVTISDCSVSANIYAKQSTNSSLAYEVAGGIAGYVETTKKSDSNEYLGSNLYMTGNTFTGNVNVATTDNMQKGTLIGCFNCDGLLYAEGNQIASCKIVHGYYWQGQRSWNTNAQSITTADVTLKGPCSGFKAIDI